MANVAVERQYLQDIADAIRARYAAAPAPTPLTVTENGVYPAESAVGFGPVTVNVESGGSAVVEPLSVTANGSYAPGSGVDGYNPVTVNVQPTLQSKTVTANGTVTPDAGYDGLSSVMVNVQGQQTYTIQVNLNGDYSKNGNLYVTANDPDNLSNYKDTYLIRSGSVVTESTEITVVSGGVVLVVCSGEGTMSVSTSAFRFVGHLYTTDFYKQIACGYPLSNGVITITLS